MCLAIPVQIIELLPDQMARCSLDGIVKVISLALLDGIKVGDYVILHTGYALARIDGDEAQKTLELLKKAGEQTDEEAIRHDQEISCP